MHSLLAPLTKTAGAGLILLFSAACADSSTPSGPTALTVPASSELRADGADNLLNGAVYTATDAIPNEVVAYFRAPDGTLKPAGKFLTGGNGSNANLPGQGSVVLSGGASAEVAVGGNQLLFVTNTGSNTLSVFQVEKDGLVLVSTAPTGGSRPLSVTVHQNLAYVVHQGSGNITGFWVTSQGQLTPIPGSSRPLTNPAGNPAQVGFSPDGRFLVTEGRESQIIDTYIVDKNTGLVEGPHSNVLTGQPEPFSFTFDRKGHLFMTEGHFATPGAGTTSSYDILEGGTLRPISSGVPNLQGVPCWIVITENQKVIYEANALSSTISSYTVRPDGTIVLKESIAGMSGSFPGAGAIDLAITKGSQYLYSASASLNGGTIVGFTINPDGTLTEIGLQAAGLPPTISGLASR
ncbi:MAG TPA: beta-propeller fold lactonase family protein [Gemmatimonadaceae bacterium]|nr:beta-propeller fold lactonase family protein [Gemmatimonadaceae bacterium]